VIAVSSFSATEVPWKDSIMEWAYYWFFAYFLGDILGSEDYQRHSPKLLIKSIGVCIFMLGEAGNMIHHIFLSNLRENDTVYRRKIPRQGLFS
jgi:hypothetical protein